MKKTNLYEEITSKFIEALKGGRIPWRKPWGGCAGGARSFESGRAYSFLNQMLIQIELESRFTGEITPEIRDYMEKVANGRFVAFSALKSHNGRINKGAKSYLITFFKHFQPNDKDGQPMTTTNLYGEEVPVTIPVLRTYRVFSEFDCTGIPEEKIEQIKFDPIEEAERVIAGYVGKENGGCEYIVKLSDRAFYSPRRDCVVVPKPTQFKRKEEFYGTVFHELTHSTGHPSRLNREEKKVAAFGSEDYSREELVAEMGSAMCLGRLGIDSAKAFKNSVAYVQSWLRALQNDEKMIFWAASRAEKAVKWLFGERGE